ncbi:OsmC family protein [Gillisia sp. M10.2A]|uniref:OsmC family protein n=1 Tax=Gillisia lutea TaxID=2909668 RepID=A0ABS9EDZ8_9FLAO|nr:OsmC family protein [Gillisia lutea]MCF4100404.1 OsmC family protein [Gillisia lutea]
MKQHRYSVNMEWTGNLGKGTAGYSEFSRAHKISASHKLHDILGSSDPAFRGEPSCYNPEELLVSSISSCHMLWYLHLCAVNKIIVINYTDSATGVMEEDINGSGKFKEVSLYPLVKVEKREMIQKAYELHEEANKMCFIANSCNFQITHHPEIDSLD